MHPKRGEDFYAENTFSTLFCVYLLPLLLLIHYNKAPPPDKFAIWAFCIPPGNKPSPPFPPPPFGMQKNRDFFAF